MAFDVITPVRLGQAAIGIAVSTLYTTPAATRTFVKDIDVANTTATVINLRIHLVPAAGAAGTGNALFYDYQVIPNAVVQWTGSQIMSEGDTLQVQASAVGLTVTVGGGEAV